MKTLIDKLITLADKLDSLGFNKDADALDQLISKTAAGEDFGDLMKLFDRDGADPAEYEMDEEAPGKRVVVIDDADITPIEEDETPLAQEKTGPSRLDMLKRRHQLLKLKNQIDKAEKSEMKDDVEEEGLPHPSMDAIPEGLEDLGDEAGFEDEDEEGDMAMNEADDSLLDTLKEKLKAVPEIATKLLTLVKDNPELLEFLL